MIRGEPLSPQRRTLIRKTSLLHKIEPTALRSSFADICIAGANSAARLSPPALSDRNRCMEKARRPVTSRHALRSGRSPLHDVRHHARSSLVAANARIFVSHERVGFNAGFRHRRKHLGAVWWSQTGSNRRPPACKAGALPTELWPRQTTAAAAFTAAALPSHGSRTARQRSPRLRERRLVGLGRFELPTSRLSSARSNQLSYKPGSEDRGRTTENG
jgi:hypothetical protein